jgi:hypothetical protein
MGTVMVMKKKENKTVKGKHTIEYRKTDRQKKTKHRKRINEVLRAIGI